MRSGSFLLLSSAIFLVMAACLENPQTAVSSTPAPTTELIATAALPTLIPTAIPATPTLQPPTATPTAPPTAPPTAVPSLTPTPTATIPADLQVISPENAGQLGQLAQWGNGRIDSLTWSNDGTIFAVGSSLGVDFYNSQSLELIQTIRDEQDGSRANQIQFSPSGEFLIMSLGGDLMDRFTLWQLSTGQFVRQLLDAVLAGFSPDGLVVYYEWSSQQLQQLIWQDPTTGESVRTVTFPFTPHSINLASETAVELNQGSSLNLYNMNGDRPYLTLELPVDDAAISPDGVFLAASSRDGFVYLWDRASGRRLHELATEPDRLFDIIFSPNGRFLASSSGDKPIQIWDTGSGQLLHQVAHQTGPNNDPIFAFSPDSSELAVANGNNILFFDAATGIQLRQMANQYNFASELAFWPDSDTLLVSDGDRVYSIDIPNTAVAVVEDGVFQARNAVTSPDGRLEIGIGPFGALEMWDTATGQGVWGQYDGQMGVFSQDGRYLATVSKDGVVRLWGVPVSMP